MDVNLEDTSETEHSPKSPPSQAPRSGTTGAYTVTCSDTRSASGDAIEYWIYHTRSNHGSLHFPGFAATPAFRGGTLVQRNAVHQLVDCWSDGVHYSRTDADVRADGHSASLLIVPRRGVLNVEQGADRIRLQPGQGVIVSKSRAAQLRHDSWARGWTFDTVDARWRATSEQRPVMVDLRHGLGSIVRTMIWAVSKQHRRLDSYEFARSCATINDLLLACALDHGGLPDTLQSVERAVREYVAQHADDPDLTPSTVAHSLGWSVRQVQLALQRAGTTTSDLIRSTRLTHAADLLRNAPPGTTITSIAFASGFRSMTTFEVVFKKEFGLTPGEARNLHKEGEHFPPSATSGPYPDG
jgi:AraC-like DNA-binding protein